MPDSQLTFDIEALVDRARSLWLDALDQETSTRVELFVKVSLRSKAARDLARTEATTDHTHESGIAVRVFRAGHDHAGFAAASGLTKEVVRWAVYTAGRFATRTSSAAPRASDVVASERWDLDAAAELPTEDALTTSVMSRPTTEWVEAGTTLEVLIGVDGWLAARRRHRLWALDGGTGSHLSAQRGFAGWERLADASCTDVRFGAQPTSGDLGGIAFAPHAASAVVAALVETLHGAEAVSFKTSGRGWEISDRPVHPCGLAGGSFDDAGFETTDRVLAANGFWMGNLAGPGTLRRGSFRQPPADSPSNLVMASGEDGSIPDGALIARRCRVLRASNELWVLELDLVDDLALAGVVRRWISVQPQTLLEACMSRLGGSKVTPTGPIVPWLLFDGLAAIRGKKPLS